MTNSVDPDTFANSVDPDVSSGSTLFAKVSVLVYSAERINSLQPQSMSYDKSIKTLKD